MFEACISITKSVSAASKLAIIIFQNQSMDLRTQPIGKYPRFECKLAET